MSFEKTIASVAVASDSTVRIEYEDAWQTTLDATAAAHLIARLQWALAAIVELPDEDE